ncbi:MAG: hypothetical protein ACRDZ0_05705 [Acidimicrobiales bacterium]
MPQLELSIDIDHTAVDVDDLQVSGTLVGPDGAHAFVGWVGLLALLQRAVTVQDPSTPAGE